jgi:sugar phosphate isomerase/epimerase
MDLVDGLGLLTYSTLVHPADTWEDLWASVQTYLPPVKARVCPDAPFGVSLRLSAATADRLANDGAARDDLRRFLAENDMFVYTANAFPYGPFKDRVVKQAVYEPDWRSERRVQYTMQVADILSDLAPAGVDPSIQPSPLGFKPNVSGEDIVAAYTENVLRVAEHLVAVERVTGRTVTLAIEPEPYCFLETTPETIAYFSEHLYTDAASERLGGEAALRRHLGIVFDICHQAVEYEDIGASLQALVDARIPIFKLQEAAAIHVPEVGEEAVETLRRYAQTIYLTQTYERRNDTMNRYLNLEDAFAAWEREPEDAEWRTHVHVPVFLDDLGAFRSTRFAIEEALAFHKRTPLSAQLEVETYTWDVLPTELKSGDIVEYVCRELEWVRDQLT